MRLPTFKVLPFLGLLLGATATYAQVPIIPKPQHVNVGQGVFKLHQGERISAPANARAQWIAHFLHDKVHAQTGLSLPVIKAPGKAQIVLRIDPSIHGQGAYHLKVTPRHVTISASDNKGLLWGVQSLRQLLPLHAQGDATLPALSIQDRPHYTWRGFMLDTVRHFYPVSFIKKQIALMSYYKFDVFHWHLTGDQGWRIQIKRYPKLTSVGAWRTGADGKRHGGFYTQAQIRDVVAYARKRNVMIVPEIEMPGHSIAAIAAYPQLSCNHKQIAVDAARGVSSRAVCIDKPTFTFLENVLDEVIKLFPSPYIHIGGDEVPEGAWSDCQPCQKLARDKGLKGEAALHGHFVEQIQKYLTRHGKTMVGWDEILEGHLAPSAVVETWHGPAFVTKAVANGNRLIVSGPFYLDRISAPIKDRTLQDLYRSNPLDNPAYMDHPKYVLGGEAPLWSEFATPLNAMALIYPRLLAISEHMWNPTTHDWDNFRRRVHVQEQWLASQHVHYGPADQGIIDYHVSFRPAYHRWRLRAVRGFDDMRVHYTTNGTQPTATSPAFGNVLDFYKPETITAAPFMHGVQYEHSKVFQVVSNLALGDPVTYGHAPMMAPSSGPSPLTDGILGRAYMETMLRSGRWVGWRGTPMQASIDLKESTPVHSIGARFLQYITMGHIMLPQSVRLETSTDGKHWTTDKVAHLTVHPDDIRPQVRHVTFTAKTPIHARYVRVVAMPYQTVGQHWSPVIVSDEIIVK